RAGRDQSLNANCYILYNDEDLNKHFDLLNETKLNFKEIQSIWKAVKELTRVRENVSQSALEIARIAGWDENIFGLETKVTTAIAALEDAGYVERGQNSPRIFANSILAKTMIEANKKIEESKLFEGKDLEYSKRIISSLIGKKTRSNAGNDEAESRVDYISDTLGIPKESVIKCITLLREAKILTDDKDLSVFLRNNGKPGVTLRIIDGFVEIIKNLLNLLEDEPKEYNIKYLNEVM